MSNKPIQSWSSQLTSAYYARVNAQGIEEHWNNPFSSSPFTRIGVYAIHSGGIVLAAIAAVESVALAILTGGFLIIYPLSARPYRFLAARLNSSAFTVVWNLSSEKNRSSDAAQFLTRESFARCCVGNGRYLRLGDQLEAALVASMGSRMKPITKIAEKTNQEVDQLLKLEGSSLSTELDIQRAFMQPGFEDSEHLKYLLIKDFWGITQKKRGHVQTVGSYSEATRSSIQAITEAFDLSTKPVDQQRLTELLNRFSDDRRWIELIVLSGHQSWTANMSVIPEEVNRLQAFRENRDSNEQFFSLNSFSRYEDGGDKNPLIRLIFKPMAERELQLAGHFKSKFFTEVVKPLICQRLKDAAIENAARSLEEAIERTKSLAQNATIPMRRFILAKVIHKWSEYEDPTEALVASESLQQFALLRTSDNDYYVYCAKQPLRLRPIISQDSQKKAIFEIYRYGVSLKLHYKVDYSHLNPATCKKIEELRNASRYDDAVTTSLESFEAFQNSTHPLIVHVYRPLVEMEPENSPFFKEYWDLALAGLKRSEETKIWLSEHDKRQAKSKN